MSLIQGRPRVEVFVEEFRTHMSFRGIDARRVSLDEVDEGPFNVEQCLAYTMADRRPSFFVVGEQDSVLNEYFDCWRVR